MTGLGDLLLDNSFMVYAKINNHYTENTLARGRQEVKAFSRVFRVQTCWQVRVSLAEGGIVAPGSRHLVPGCVEECETLPPETTTTPSVFQDKEFNSRWLGKLEFF